MKFPRILPNGFKRQTVVVNALFARAVRHSSCTLAPIAEARVSNRPDMTSALLASKVAAENPVVLTDERRFVSAGLQQEGVW